MAPSIRLNALRGFGSSPTMNTVQACKQRFLKMQVANAKDRMRMARADYEYFRGVLRELKAELAEMRQHEAETRVREARRVRRRAQERSAA